MPTLLTPVPLHTLHPCTVPAAPHLVTLIAPSRDKLTGSRSLPAEPPFEALPAVTGAAVVGMLVATAVSLLAVRCVARHRDNLPRECRGGGSAGHPGQWKGPRHPHLVCSQGCTTYSSTRECPNPLALVPSSHCAHLAPGESLVPPRASPEAPEIPSTTEDAPGATNREDRAEQGQGDAGGPSTTASAGTGAHLSLIHI